MVPILERIGQAIRFTAAAFNEFITGILAGFGSTAILGNWLMTVFGPILGPYFYSQLLRMRDALDGTREAVIGFFEGISTGGLVGSIRAALGTIQGFFEWLFTGTAQLSNVNLMNQLGEMLGLDNFSVTVREFVNDVQFAITAVIGLFQALANAARPILEDIRQDLAEVFDRQTFGDALSFVVALLTGFAEGLILAGAAALQFARILADLLANVGSFGDAFGAWVEQLTGVQITLENFGETLGLVFGTILGGLALRALIPFAGLITGVAATLAVFAVRTAAATVPLILFAAQTAIATVRLLAFAASELVVAGVTALLGSMMGIAALAIIGIGLALAAAVAYIYGFDAAVQAVTEMVNGFLSVMVPIASVLLQVGAGIVMLIGQFAGFAATLTNAVGIHTSFYNIGQAVAGLLLGAMAVALVTTIAGWVGAALAMSTATMVIFLIIAAVAALVVVLASLGYLDETFNGLAAGFTFVRDAVVDLYNWVKSLFGEIESGAEAAKSSVGDLQADVQADIFEQERLDEARKQQNAMRDASGGGATQEQLDRRFNDAWNLWNETQHGGMQQVTFGLGETVTMDPVQFQRHKANVQRAGLMYQQAQEEAFVKGAEQKKGNFLSDHLPKVLTDSLEAIGVDLSNLSVSGLIDKLGAEKYAKEYQAQIEQAMGASTKDILKNEYDRAVSTWEEYSKLVQAVGRPMAEQMYRELGKEIPTNPGTYEAWSSDQVDQIDTASQEQLAAIEQMKGQLQQAIESMDLGSVLSTMFGDGAGGIMTAGEGLFSIGEQIMQNIGDKGPWVNMTEILADAAGSGLFLGRDISGQNVHTALAPYLEKLAEQTGMTITDIMKGIDKYIVPEEFVPIATGELLQGLNNIPVDLYSKLDTLGAGQFTEFGLDWAELVEYGIGQGLAGKDWNLTDYIASSWDMSTADAEQYLIDNGIDPNAITQAWFEDTQMMIDSMGGQISVLTEEWWTYLAEKTNNFTDKTIEMTRENFNALPDAVKIGFSQLGYTFIIGGEEAVAAMDQTANMVAEHMRNSAQVMAGGDMDAFWAALWEDAGEGILDNARFTFTDVGNGLVEIYDSITGVTVRVPAIELQDFTTSVAAFADALDDLENLRRRREEIKNALEALYSEEARIAAGNKATQDAGFVTGGWGEMALGNVQADITPLEERLTRIRTAIDELKGLTGENAVQVDIAAPQVENLEAYKGAIETATKEAIETGTSNAVSTLAVDTTAFATFGTNAATSFQTAFSEAMAGWSPTMPSTGGTGTAGTEDPTTGMPMAAPTETQGIVVKVTMDKTAFDNDLAAALVQMETFNSATYDAALDLITSDFYTKMFEVKGQLTSYDNNTSEATLLANDLQAALVINAVQAALDKIASTYTATLSAIDNASSTISAVQSGLDALDGRIVTSTINNVTNNINNTTNNVTNNTTSTARAGGGVTKWNEALTLVGEEGPEIAAFPSGTRVQSSANTMQMLRDAVRSAISPREHVSAPASAEFRNARQWHYANSGAGGNVNVEINNLTITKDVDIDRAFERIDRISGRKMELARRGMASYEHQRTL